MIEIPITINIDVPSTKQITITNGIINFLHLDFDNTCAYMKISYKDEDVVVAKRFFRVCGMTYGNLISTDVTGNLAEIVIGRTAQFAMNIVAKPDMIDGEEIIEMEKSEFIHEMMTLMV